MLLPLSHTRYVATLTHEGKVLIVASTKEDGVIQLHYSIKQDGFERSALNDALNLGWETFKKLELPGDSVGDKSVELKEEAEKYEDESGSSQFIQRSIYHSAKLTADAPVQLVSHDGHVYLFRQSTEGGTLLVDRFILDGMTNTLRPKLEVRFKRSRQRYQPLKEMKINAGGQMESVDSPDFRDMNKLEFTEPTTELCPACSASCPEGSSPWRSRRRRSRETTAGISSPSSRARSNW